MLKNKQSFWATPRRLDIEKTIKEIFRFVGTDIMSECTFKALLVDWDILPLLADGYTISLRLWEEHRYITVLRLPGHPRYIELGANYERDYPHL